MDEWTESVDDSAHGGHTAGVEAIEGAFDKIIQEKLSMRKKVKGMKAAMKKKKEGEDYTPPFLERLKEQFARPDDQTIIRRAVLFAILVRRPFPHSTMSRTNLTDHPA